MCARDQPGGEAVTPAETFVYYVEFRAARNGVYGHTYIAYGQLKGSGSPAIAQYADIHPNGGFLKMVLGHFIPIAAETEPVEETLQREVIRAYRRTLSAEEYQALMATLARVRARCRWWHVFVYNCNDFVAEIARAVGLRTPTTLMRPYEFIPALHRLNEAARAAAPEHAPPASPPQPEPVHIDPAPA